MKETCRECNGDGTKVGRTITLPKSCNKCHGEGKVEWVDNIRKKYNYSVESSYETNLTYRNIDLLIQIIREEAFKINKKVYITVEDDYHNIKRKFEIEEGDL